MNLIAKVSLVALLVAVSGVFFLSGKALEPAEGMRAISFLSCPSC